MPTPHYASNIKGPLTAHFRSEVVEKDSRRRIRIPNDLYEDMKLEGKHVAEMARRNKRMGAGYNPGARIVSLLRVALNKGIDCYEHEHGSVARPSRKDVTAWCKAQSKNIMQDTQNLRRANRMADFGYGVTKGQMEAFRSGWALGAGTFRLEPSETLDSQSIAARRRHEVEWALSTKPRGEILNDIVREQIKRYRDGVEPMLLLILELQRQPPGKEGYAICRYRETGNGSCEPLLHKPNEFKAIPKAKVMDLLHDGYLDYLSGADTSGFLLTQEAMIMIGANLGLMKADRPAEEVIPNWLEGSDRVKITQDLIDENAVAARALELSRFLREPHAIKDSHVLRYRTEKDGIGYFRPVKAVDKIPPLSRPAAVPDPIDPQVVALAYRMGLLRQERAYQEQQEITYLRQHTSGFEDNRKRIDALVLPAERPDPSQADPA